MLLVRLGAGCAAGQRAVAASHGLCEPEGAEEMISRAVAARTLWGPRKEGRPGSRSGCGQWRRLETW